MKLLRNAKQYWKQLMESTRKKMSQGAQDIAKIIRSARKDNWRRKDKVQNRPQEKQHKD